MHNALSQLVFLMLGSYYFIYEMAMCFPEKKLLIKSNSHYYLYSCKANCNAKQINRMLRSSMFQQKANLHKMLMLNLDIYIKLEH